MERTLKLKIVAGEKTCAVRQGEFCRFVHTTNYGTKFRCGVFGDRLEDKDGWLQRLPECLAAE